MGSARWNVWETQCVIVWYRTISQDTLNPFFADLRYMFLALAIPAFIAGFLTFLAPCTLPLVPGYLAFISGVSIYDANKNGEMVAYIRKKILWNAILYVLGFSVIFILLGTTFSGIGGIGLAKYRFTLERISGSLILVLGLYMTHLFDLPFLRFLNIERRFSFTQKLAPGKPMSSFLFGAMFAFGWTPCIGPILGSILLLASTGTTVLQGTLLLAIFSLGLAIPFLLVAIGISHAMRVIKHVLKYISAISVIGGIFIALIGLLVLTGKMGLWIAFFYHLFSFINYQNLIHYF